MKTENGSVNPTYEILFPIVKCLDLTTGDLFNVEPDEHNEEINRWMPMKKKGWRNWPTGRADGGKSGRSKSRGTSAGHTSA